MTSDGHDPRDTENDQHLGDLIESTRDQEVKVGKHSIEEAFMGGLLLIAVGVPIILLARCMPALTAFGG